MEWAQAEEQLPELFRLMQGMSRYAMDRGENYDKSWMLYHILDSVIGSSELVAIRRKLNIVEECSQHGRSSKHAIKYNAGSKGEGFTLPGSDIDWLFINDSVIVLDPDQYSDMTIYNNDKTIVLMRETNCQPGYVALELVHSGTVDIFNAIANAKVAMGDAYYVSSEMYRCSIVESTGILFGVNLTPHGPCATATIAQVGGDFDIAFSFTCTCWPKEASEWVSRIRHNDWPSQVLRASIIQDGCHLVPVGDNSSPDTFLQWRISFATSERKLVHSLSHHQFMVYGLLKIFLKQIKDMIKRTTGDADILSSYIMKTAIFWAVETTPQAFWQEKNTFVCFWFCVSTLIVWVQSGFCPNYFVIRNNMFLSKVHGDNQRKLVCLLIDLHDKKWMCLSAGLYLQHTIGDLLQYVTDGGWKGVILSPMEQEWRYDKVIFNYLHLLNDAIYRSVTLLDRSASDVDEFIAYHAVVRSLSTMAIDMYKDHNVSGSNKQRYNVLKKCRNLLTPFASVCKSPGLLQLATYYYQTGHYTKALEMCRPMGDGFKMYFGVYARNNNKDVYQHRYCGRGYSLHHKCKEVYTSCVGLTTKTFAPSQLELQPNTSPKIPPLPYSVFLSFLCYHELGDIRRRGEASTDLRAVQYDEEQGGQNHWIVHHLVGICYEIVGDIRRAIREYNDSMNGSLDQRHNPAMERIERLRHSL